MKPRCSDRASALVVLLLVLTGAAPQAVALEVGFGETDITPPLEAGRPVWLAGYGMGRRATGVHDPLRARAVVLRDGEHKIALACVDLVGLQYPEVLRIRQALPDYQYVMVSSTHNHEGPDVIGIWGASPIQRGVDDAYVDLVVERTVSAIRQAEKKLAPAEAAFGTASDETLVGDSRLPKVKDGVIRLLRFSPPDGGAPLGLLVQWTCHPEAMGSRNTLVTADFVAATVAKLTTQFGCPVAYFSGAVGGLMAPPDGLIRDGQGKILEEGDFAYSDGYGAAVASLAAQAVIAAEPVRLTPFAVASKRLAVPVENKLYRAARSLGVLKRAGWEWTGDAEKFAAPHAGGDSKALLAVETEVACVELGEVRVACIPGEIYPELVYGKYQDPVEPNVDFPDAPLEPSVTSLMPGPKWLLVGLANDEIGYIIPKRQWDEQAPFAYGRSKSQYGEINSCGPEVAPIIMRAFQRCVQGLHGK